MTDVITGNQLDIMAFDSGLTNDQQREQLRGTRFADWVENRARDAVSYLHQASQDQEGIGDDILRFGGNLLQGAGNIAEAPGIKQTLQLLDAPVHYLAQGAGNVAENLGIDPRLGEWGVRAAELGLTMGGGVAKKAGKLGKLDDLARLASNKIDDLTIAGMRRTAQPVHAAFDGASDVQRTTGLLDEMTDLRRSAEVQNTKRAKSWQDNYGLSQLSTGPDLTGLDPLVFGEKTRKAFRVAETQLTKSPAKQFHHKFTKSVSTPYFDKAWELQRAGKATKEDILDLHKILLDKAVGSGDRKSALLLMDKIPHDVLHDVMRKAGVEPFKDQVALAGNKVKNFKTFKELKADLISAVDDMAVPMTREAERLNDAWEKIPESLRAKLIDLRGIRTQLNKQFKKDPKNLKLNIELREASNNYNQLKKQLLEEMDIHRARQGSVLDEFGQIAHDSYGHDEILKELRIDKALRGAE